jgi:dihydroflavonol-4-reductase
VTGATGLLGGELVKQLVGRGHQVAALVRSREKASLLAALGVELHVGDITDRDSLRTGLQGADGVFHVAGMSAVGLRQPDATAERVNVHGTRVVLEVAHDLAIPRTVYTSALSVFGDTRGVMVDETCEGRGPVYTEHDRTKRMAQDEVAVPMLRAGMPLVIVMPGAIYGPGDTSLIRGALAQLLRRRLFATPKGTMFCWGYVEDIARGLRQAMDAGEVGETYILAGPAHTVQHVYATAARLTARRPPPLHPPPPVMRAAASLAAALERFDLRLPHAAETLRLLAGTTWIGSSAKARQALGFAARPLEEGLKHTIEHELRQLGMA